MVTERRETTWIENWYEITDFNNGVVAIGEPKHDEEVYSYLVKGKDSDLLIDTGMGIIPITYALEKLRSSSKPLTVVNTHWHFDHVGGNSHFDRVFVPKNIEEVAGILHGWTAEELAKYRFVAGFQKGGTDNTPPNFDPKEFFIPPYKHIDPVLKNGYKIDLGDRGIFVYETPGHTPGSVCLFDKTNGLLFTADVLYEGPLYAFEAESDPNKYLNSLRRIKRMLGDQIKVIHPGHNFPENDYEPDLLTQAIKLFVMAKAKKPYDGKSIDFDNAVEYIQPGKRRLKIVVDKKYVSWE